MKNGSTMVAAISAMLNIINVILQQSMGALPDLAHSLIAIILAVATLVAIWRIDVKRNNDHGERRH
jgi:uncharacterized membrane protein YhaH (DUF805 family)